ncbi:hypothetical protein [Streptacidiphilus sp. PAMC 29251]
MSSKRNQAAALPNLADAYRLASVEAVVETAARDFAAQIAATELRRASHPGRATWAPTDQTEPAPVPQTVVDGDGDLWLRTPAPAPGPCRTSTPDTTRPAAARR